MVESTASGSHKVTVKVLDRVIVSSEAELGKDMFPSSRGGQNSVPFSLLDQEPQFLAGCGSEATLRSQIVVGHRFVSVPRYMGLPNMIACFIEAARERV